MPTRNRGTSGHLSKCSGAAAVWRAALQVAAGCLAGVLFLCSSSATLHAAGKSPASPGRNDAGRAVRTPVIAARPVALLQRDWEGVEQLISRQRGKVVVVDIWTTTCPICRAEFPDFAALRRRFGSDAVYCISVNCDYDGVPDKPPAFYQPQVREFLGQHPEIDLHVMLTESFLSFLKRIDLRSTPAVLVYDPRGQLVRRFDNDESRSEADDFTMQQVSRLVSRLTQTPSLP